MSDQFNEEELLADLRSGATSAFEKLYKRYYRMVEDLVFKMGGTTEEARDSFQETLLVFVEKLRDPQFSLHSKISTYLYAVARNTYLKKATKRNRSMEIARDKNKELDIEKVLNDYDHEKDSAIELILEKLKELDKDCQELLLHSFYRNLSQDHIARIMGYSPAYVKVKKFRCLQYLRKSVMDSSLYKKLNLE